MLKSELRAALAVRLRALTPAARQRESVAICQAIRAQAVWGTARLVCAFLPLPGEPQIAELWAHAGAAAFCFPRVRAGEVTLIRSDDPALLRRANWKFEAEEFAAAAIVAPAEVDLFLVPGVSFTRAGLRLGRGGGYYDRLLVRRAAASTALGLCFACQLTPELPTEPHDQRVDAVITGCAA